MFRFLVLSAALFLSSAGAYAESDEFPVFLESQTAQQQTASYSCIAECTLRSQDRATGAVYTDRLSVGPATVTVGTPSEDAIHAAAQVALTGKCPAACADALRAGRRELSCRLSGTGPCSRVHR